MKKIRKKLVREKVVIAIYQYILIETSEEEIKTFISHDNNQTFDPDEVDYCLKTALRIIEKLDSMLQVIGSHLKKGWTVDRLSKMDTAILLVAVYELLDEQVDKKVVINEAVELTKKYCDDDSFKFINGVLNSI